MDEAELRERHIDRYDRLGRIPINRGQATDPVDSDDEYDVETSLPSTPLESYPSRKLGPPDIGHDLPRVGHIKVERTSEDEDEEEEEDTLRAVDDEGEFVQPEAETDPRVCRICFGGVEEEDTLGKLISPCLCTGSMRVSTTTLPIECDC